MKTEGKRPHDGLPSGWSWTTLGEIGRYHNGRAFKKTDWADKGRPIIRIQNLTDPTKPYNHFAGDAEERHTVRSGDLLVSWAATLNAFTWNGPEAVLNQHIFKVESAIDPAFHYWVLKSAIAELYARSHGSGMVHVTRGVFDALPVAVPSIAEQRLVVAELEGRFRSLDIARAPLGVLRRTISQYRVAARDAAFSGASGVVPLEDQAVVHSGVAISAAKATGDKDVPYLSTANVQAGRLELTTVKAIRATAAQREKHRLQDGDVLVLEGGDPDKVGRGWLWQGEIDGCLHQNHVFAVRPDPAQLSPRFLAHFINAPQARAFFLSQAKQTTGIASINKTQLRALRVPEFSLAEQARRVTTLEEQLAHADRLEAAVATVEASAERLRASVLYQAMSGQLPAMTEQAAA